MEIKQVHVISSSEGEKGGEWGRERRAASREEGDDGENHGYKDGGWRKGDAQRGPPRGRGRMNSRMIEYSRKRDYLQWMLALLLWLGVWAGSYSDNLCLRLPPLQKPSDEQQLLHSFQGERERERKAGR